MSNGFQTVGYTAGQVLFEPGDPAERLYVIQSGEIAIVDRARNHTLAVLHPGESFGEQSLIAGGIRSMAAQAVGAATCLEITAQGLREMLAHEERIVTPVIEALCLQLCMHNAIRGPRG